MKTTLSALVQLFFASSVIADSQSFLPAIHARSLGMKAIHKARSELLSGRKLQFDDTDIGDLDINVDEVLPMLAPMICFLMDESKDNFVDEMAV